MFFIKFHSREETEQIILKILVPKFFIITLFVVKT